MQASTAGFLRLNVQLQCLQISWGYAEYILLVFVGRKPVRDDAAISKICPLIVLLLMRKKLVKSDLSLKVHESYGKDQTLV